ncbi:hypothetical protein ASD11_09185 [Aeromicrobium sp. Root495]|uniref:TetR/AcrR family transcriptional regulator n=1 Tax=Aeromicrobium sp. Root495 TaxID=1736550 RepID=UPI0006F56723|nr:TetR/AcrR family transcriptional regulator [Aeromicrobium sp. Root495]KQY59706.1 hypothetical protein ASD11_09185 [Aeromicrobium sp. Root495]
MWLTSRIDPLHAGGAEGTGRPRAAHLGPEARRPLVLDAALQVWNDLGAAGVTMAAVAEQAQVSKPVLYECFESKDAVLLALLEREERRLLRSALGSLPESVDPDDPRRDVARAYRSFFDAVSLHPLSWRVVFDAQQAATSGVPSVVGRRYRAARAQVVSQVAVLLEVAELAPSFHGPAELAVVAEHAVSLAERNGWVLLQDDHDWQADTLADLVARILLSGLSGPTPA